MVRASAGSLATLELCQQGSCQVLGEHLPVFLRRCVKVVEGMLRASDDASLSSLSPGPWHPTIRIGTRNFNPLFPTHSFVAMLLVYACWKWWKSLSFRVAFRWNVSIFLHEVYVSYVNLSLAQQMALDKSANFCGPVLCSSYLTPAFVPGKWAALLVYVCLLHLKK